MKQLNINEIHKIELNLLDKIDEICRKNNLRYSLCAGTLLGAVRHKGFIPWDDDADIMMPRPDYNRFIELCKNISDDYKMFSYEKNRNWTRLLGRFTYTKTQMKSTESVFKNRSFVNHGLYIDIFPIEVLGNDKENIEKYFNENKIYRQMLDVKRSVYSFTPHYPYKNILKNFIFGIKTRFVSKDKIFHALYDPFSKFTFDSSEFVGNIYSSGYGLKQIHERKMFEEYIELEFEGRKYKCIKDYDTYLKRLYKNYMELPPESSRIPHLSATAFIKD